MGEFDYSDTEVAQRHTQISAIRNVKINLKGNRYE